MGRIWLLSKKKDIVFLFSPVFICWLVCFCVPELWHEQQLSIWVWLFIILGIDVSHVWSTIFRTYLDKEEWEIRPKLLLLIPILSFLALFTLGYFSIEFFWRGMAYLALYHFVKQQYGFLAYYQFVSGTKKKPFLKDKWVMYLGVLYPIIYWHISGDRNFEWFVEGDFINLSNKLFLAYSYVFEIVYWLVLLVWIIQEKYYSILNKERFLWGKVLWMSFTWINWYLGIVYFNSDLAFTLTNVIAHGIPYMAFNFSYIIDKKQFVYKIVNNRFNKILIIISFIVIVFCLSLFEEFWWDNLLYQEKGRIFNYFFDYFSVPLQNKNSIAFALAMLSLPQVTHYILDAYIWKINDKNPYILKVLLRDKK